MRSINKRKNKKPILLITSAAIIIVGGGLAYLAIARPFSSKQTATTTNTPDRPANTVDYNSPTQAEQQTQDATKNNVVNNDTSQSKTTSSITASLVRADQGGNGQPLNIRVDISGTTSGTCHITLTRAGQPTISKDFTVGFEATSSYCVNADIPASEFSESGAWQLKIVVASGSQESKAIETTVTVAK